MKTQRQNIGKFRDKIRIEAQSLTADGAGGYTNTWTEVDTVFGDLTPMEGREGLDAEALIGKSPVEVIVRYSANLEAVDSDNRLVIGSNTYNVHSVHDLDNEKHFLMITAWKV